MAIDKERAWYDRMKRLDSSASRTDDDDGAPFGMPGSFSSGGFTFSFGFGWGPFAPRPSSSGTYPSPPKNEGLGGLTTDDIAILHHSCMRSPRMDVSGDGPEVSRRDPFRESMSYHNIPTPLELLHDIS